MGEAYVSEVLQGPQKRSLIDIFSENLTFKLDFEGRIMPF